MHITTQTPAQRPSISPFAAANAATAEAPSQLSTRSPRPQRPEPPRQWPAGNDGAQSRQERFYVLQPKSMAADLRDRTELPEAEEGMRRLREACPGMSEEEMQLMLRVDVLKKRVEEVKRVIEEKSCNQDVGAERMVAEAEYAIHLALNSGQHPADFLENMEPDTAGEIRREQHRTFRSRLALNITPLLRNEQFKQVLEENERAWPGASRNFLRALAVVRLHFDTPEDALPSCTDVLQVEGQDRSFVKEFCTKMSKKLMEGDRFAILAEENRAKLLQRGGVLDDERVAEQAREAATQRIVLDVLKEMLQPAEFASLVSFLRGSSAP